MSDYKKEWFRKSQVDYFANFITLWLSCNSWYNFQYALSNDRAHINKVKSDFTNTNKLYKEFDRIYTGQFTKEQKSLFSNIELLQYSLNRQLINPNTINSDNKFIKVISLEFALIDYNQHASISGYIDLTIKNAKTTAGKLKATVSGIDLGDIVLNNDSQKIFAGLFEMIYQLRCLLVHGNLEPTDENNEIIKYCYLILNDLMKPICK